MLGMDAVGRHGGRHPCRNLLRPLLLIAVLTTGPFPWQSTWAAGLSANYAGMMEDHVGRGHHAAPNGQEDARFHVVLETGRERKTVKDIVLQSVDRQGRPRGGQFWDTRPGGGEVLGVYRASKRLNPIDRAIPHRVQGRVEYDLYANPGDFRPGQRFRIAVKFTDGSEATGLVTVDVPVATLSARYAGMLEDRVGQGNHAGANGIQDARFSLSLDTRGARWVVKGIVLRSSDARGNAMGGQLWDTNPGGGWILGVYRNGERLNPSDHEITHVVDGRADYELYANPGTFKPGTYFRVGVRFAEGDEAKAVAMVDVPKAALDVTYRGMSEDVVGEGSHAGFNGQPDGRFDVVLRSGGVQRFVTGIELESVNERGQPTRAERWDTYPGNSWMLAVYRAGERLNPRDQEIGHGARDGTTYQVYANRPDGFKPGTHYRLTMHFAEGDEAFAIVTIGDATVAAPSPPVSGSVGGGRTASALPQPESRASVSSPWRAATVPFDPECKTGCREIVHVRDNHGADVVFRYNPKVDDAVAQWGDCIHSMLTCLLDESREVAPCVTEAACPEGCRTGFLERTAGEGDRRRLVSIFETMFVNEGGECVPVGQGK